MRKMTGRVLEVLALAVCLGVPEQARAVNYEDSLDDCSYPKLFDVTVMRPLSFTAMLIGSVLWIPIAPLAAATVWDEFGQVTESLVIGPARFTFKRKLGDCTGVVVAY